MSNAIHATPAKTNNVDMSKDLRQQEADALKRLYDARVEMPQSAFGELHRIGSQGMVWQYLNGKRPLNKDAAVKFAQALGVDVAMFSPRIASEIALLAENSSYSPPNQGSVSQSLERSHASNVRTAPPARKAVPVITLIQAGDMKDIGYLPRLGEGERWEVPDFKLGPRGGCAVVDGWSMWDGTDNGIRDGDLIFWDPDLAAMPNDLVIAKHVGAQTATFKQLSYEDGKWYLRPLNKDPIYKTIEIDDPQLRVIAVVTETRRQSRKLR